MAEALKIVGFEPGSWRADIGPIPIYETENVSGNSTETAEQPAVEDSKKAAQAVTTQEVGFGC